MHLPIHAYRHTNLCTDLKRGCRDISKILDTTHFYSKVFNTNKLPSLCDFSRCRSSWSGNIKNSEQCLHEYGFAPMWVRTCRFISELVLNIFPQSGQWYGLLLLCTWCLCLCSTHDWLKLLLHSEHLYSFSPVWTLMCVFRCPGKLNTIPHTWHLYGLSPVWTLMCLFRSPDSPNALSHTWHVYGFFPLWILLCFTRSPAFVHCLPETQQSNGFSPEWLRLCTAKWWLLVPVWISSVLISSSSNLSLLSASVSNSTELPTYAQQTNKWKKWHHTCT